MKSFAFLRMILRHTLFLLVFSYEGNSETLSLSEVLKNIDKHPLVAAYESKIKQQSAEVLISQGSFDTSLNFETYNRTIGYYDGKYSKLSVKKPIADIGALIEGGYRIGNEDFPVYEEDLKTLDGGEVFLSLTVPVLRNLFIDPQRARLIEKKLAEQIANYDISTFRLKLFAQTAKAYWKWVEMGNDLEIIRSIVDIANVRLEQLSQRSKLGDLPQIDAIDAKRTLMKRKAEERKIYQEYINRANTLSLYLRDDQGEPIVVQNLNVLKPIKLKCEDLAKRDKLVQSALEYRPEIKVLDLQISQMEVSLELARNELLPNLDLKVTGQDDLGSGQESLDQPELNLGALFSVPFERRVAKGKILKAEQVIAELQSNKKFLKEQIVVELTVLHENYQRICEQINFAEKEEATSREVAEGERNKFNQGDSSLVIVNLREQDVAEAAIKVIKAKTELHITMAEILSGQGVLFIGK